MVPIESLIKTAGGRDIWNRERGKDTSRDTVVGTPSFARGFPLTAVLLLGCFTPIMTAICNVLPCSHAADDGGKPTHRRLASRETCGFPTKG